MKAAARQRFCGVSKRSGFTLIEIMMVVAIMVVALAMSFPAMSKMLHRAPLTQAVVDLTEGCRKARALAILRDTPMELEIFADGRMAVAPAVVDSEAAAADAAAPHAPANALAAAAAEIQPKPQPASDNFSAQLSDTVAIRMLDINFVDFMGSDVARVRFYPNGTSDEFTVVIEREGERRKITLEVVTGLASVQAL